MSPTYLPRSAKESRDGLQILVQADLGQGFEDVEPLTDRRASRGGGRHAVHVHALVGHLRGRPFERAVGLQVGHLHQARPHLAGGAGRDRRSLHGGDDLRAESPLVQPVATAPAELPVGLGQLGVAERGSDRRRGASGKVELRGGGEVLEPGGVGGGLVVEGLIDREPLRGDLDRGVERLLQRERAEPAQRQLPLRHAAGHPGGQPAGHGLLERDALQGRRTHRPRRRLAAVDRVDLLPPRVVVDDEPAPGQSGRVGLGHAERGRRRDRRVHRVAALAQHAQRGLARVQVDGRNRSAVPFRDGFLLHHRWRRQRGLYEQDRGPGQDSGKGNGDAMSDH